MKLTLIFLLLIAGSLGQPWRERLKQGAYGIASYGYKVSTAVYNAGVDATTTAYNAVKQSADNGVLRTYIDYAWQVGGMVMEKVILTRKSAIEMMKQVVTGAEELVLDSSEAVTEATLEALAKVKQSGHNMSEELMKQLVLRADEAVRAGKDFSTELVNQVQQRAEETKALAKKLVPVNLTTSDTSCEINGRKFICTFTVGVPTLKISTQGYLEMEYLGEGKLKTEISAFGLKSFTIYEIKGLGGIVLMPLCLPVPMASYMFVCAVFYNVGLILNDGGGFTICTSLEVTAFTVPLAVLQFKCAAIMYNGTRRLTPPELIRPSFVAYRADDGTVTYFNHMKEALIPRQVNCALEKINAAYQLSLQNPWMYNLWKKTPPENTTP